MPVGYVDPENSQSRVSDGKFDPSRGGDDVVSCLECSTHKCQPKALSGSGDHPRLCSGHAPIQTQTRRCVSFYSGPVPHLRTVKKVHAAVLRLALRAGPTALTMEGIAAEAGVGKQTLYRNWPSVTAIVFDALAHDSTPPPERPADTSVTAALSAAVEEISTEPRRSLLRSLAASIQTDDAVAQEFQERLLAPQLAQMRELVRGEGARDPVRVTEMLLAPIFYRWFMQLPQFDDAALSEHVRAVMAFDRQRD
ncbi:MULTISPECIES: TetR/AcrR family transcriptional regulator [Gordonia]|uniref:TetR/AcrR family transcriptional regulator n=1 Tax=Gordonia TaxID=2053 RepID=UPI001EF01B3B|nr:MULTISPECIES: TetR/AcrR family transcriptional regulator [Gordonia]MDV7173773.1 TetR/AcrR family transcriptional regulator [Gordonia amicalis]UKO94043.1 TetR/AcrR family transcriptional regulator [Gordonia amicalis]UOG23615.1 TetR/AcrR family transcriptional regulator [Gordonia amicalis]